MIFVLFSFLEHNIEVFLERIKMLSNHMSMKQNIKNFTQFWLFFLWSFISHANQ